MANDLGQLEFLLCGTATGAPELADPLGDLREGIAPNAGAFRLDSA
jgi:hypothetical protein